MLHDDLRGEQGMEIQGWMSSAVGHDGPLSLCNNWAVTSAATSRWDDAFPTNNHPCKIIFCKTAGHLLPSLLSEAFLGEAAR